MITDSVFFFLELDNDSIRNDREEKKRYLLRKLSFRPTVDELKNRKVSRLLPVQEEIRETYALIISDYQVQ